MTFSNPAKAGVALFIGTVQFGIFMIVAEAVWPSYSVSTNYISDLGANLPSSQIYNPSIVVLGVSVLVAALFLQRSFHWKPATCLMVLAGIGAVGVGLFPEGSPFSLHSIFSLVVFLFAGLSAIVTSRFQKTPLSYFAMILGAGTLLALILYVGQIYLGLGAGGMERMVVYPVLLWAIGFGGHLMGMEDMPRP
ncbi:MAG: DUF998 domain-containing protein [Thaumarchaeota archaeon]|nr:DUF998 domain-containing protein [Nitrososphaerota archaeon]